MKVLVIGGGDVSAGLIRQLRKCGDVDIVVSTWREDCTVCREGLAGKELIKAHITPMNAREVLDSVHPDIVFVARSAADWMHEATMMGSQYVKGMERQLLDLDVPVVIVSEDMRA